MCFCVFVLFLKFFSLTAEFFLPGEESLPGDLLPLPHLVTHNFSDSFGVSLPCHKKTAVSQLIPVVLVFAGSCQNSLLSSVKPTMLTPASPPYWGVPLPVGTGKQWVPGSSGWLVSRARKVPRGSRAQSRRLL